MIFRDIALKKIGPKKFIVFPNEPLFTDSVRDPLPVAFWGLN